MFDPEKVERCSFDDHEELHVVENGDWVLASDYDRLLEIYRASLRNDWPEWWVKDKNGLEPNQQGWIDPRKEIDPAPQASA